MAMLDMCVCVWVRVLGGIGYAIRLGRSIDVENNDFDLEFLLIEGGLMRKWGSAHQ